MSRILVVDDSQSARAALRVLLEPEGHVVIEAANGAEALQILVNTPESEPALIVLDLEMPSMSGWEFIRIVRSYHRLASVPILVVTVYPTSAAPPSIAGCIQKPVDREQLLAHVRAVSRVQ